MPKQITRKAVIFDEQGDIMDDKAARAAVQRIVSREVKTAFMNNDTGVDINFDQVVGNNISLLDLMTEAYGAPPTPEGE